MLSGFYIPEVLSTSGVFRSPCHAVGVLVWHSRRQTYGYIEIPGSYPGPFVEGRAKMAVKMAAKIWGGS